VGDAVDAVLDADTFDATAVDALARRDCYADAASYLLQGIPRASLELVPIFMCSQSFQPYRCAVAFGAIPSHDHVAQMLTIEDLRSFGTREARLALLASGEPVEWEIADRIERAVYVLRSLVNAMCGR
jgi:hypothetical protein